MAYRANTLVVTLRPSVFVAPTDIHRPLVAETLTPLSVCCQDALVIDKSIVLKVKFRHCVVQLSVASGLCVVAAKFYVSHAGIDLHRVVIDGLSDVVLVEEVTWPDPCECMDVACRTIVTHLHTVVVKVIVYLRAFIIQFLRGIDVQSIVFGVLLAVSAGVELVHA